MTEGDTGHFKMVDSANPSLAELSDVDKLVADRVVKGLYPYYASILLLIPPHLSRLALCPDSSHLISAV